MVQSPIFPYSAEHLWWGVCVLEGEGLVLSLYFYGLNQGEREACTAFLSLTFLLAVGQ